MGADRSHEGRNMQGENSDDRKSARSVWGRNTDPALDPSEDPRSRGELGKAQRAMLGLGVATGRNTNSFDPRSTLVRPMMRVRLGDPKAAVFGRRLHHDDVVIVPEFLCAKDDWTLYYKLLEEMREAQAQRVPNAEWISWHEGAHLISKGPCGETFDAIQKRVGDYFGLRPENRGTRFNWYKDASDWKPHHHDSAAFNAARARNQNCTVGISLGSTRELAFLDAKDNTRRIYFPQDNGMLFYFGRDVNINWQHGVNYVPESEQDGKGRISIILWGFAEDVLDEPGSPPMLTDATRPVYDVHASSRSRVRRDSERGARSKHGGA
ncbi:hypothetical protein CTAYLR_002460 [Chrysophaeum taylorii]|uniref:Fe2OG dioxygenase domain-containing protein n=1 Tax=Chrysophaeum taylorii TaxID=2483200 RepID=A0AAD7UM03_9STRA|nr:hypothetical protein CTAYLR_002460 [Chrysophaeum taylorii]